MSEVAAPKSKLVERIADRYGIDPTKMMRTLKATAFSGDVTDEQMLALLVVAEQYQLNPWTKEIYAFPSKQGIIPVVGVDGWSRIINNDDSFDGMDYNQSEQTVESDEHKPCPEWIECVMHRKDRSHPVVVREYFDECYRPPFKGKNGPVVGPWQTHPKRFLRHKATIQAARLAFGFVGIYDQDEAERIREIDITPRRTSVVHDAIEESKPEFSEEDRQNIADTIDNCFTLDPAEGLVLQDSETFDVQMGLLRDADLKLAVWDLLGSKVRTYISALEKGR